ncbi:hypothetical protein V5G24_23360 [Xanthobacter sp. VTT E-85241]|uniref:phage head-tail joining protein n=1 Tax=Roseixanthobacter finlandensis TaxID=3119922 RepID=UPI00372707F8
MTDTTFTAADVARLERAVAMGELLVEVELGGERQRVQYRSMSELMQALTYAKAQLAGAGGREVLPSTLAQFERG